MPLQYHAHSVGMDMGRIDHSRVMFRSPGDKPFSKLKTNEYFAINTEMNVSQTSGEDFSQAESSNRLSTAFANYNSTVEIKEKVHTLFEISTVGAVRKTSIDSDVFVFESNLRVLLKSARGGYRHNSPLAPQPSTDTHAGFTVAKASNVHRYTPHLIISLLTLSDSKSIHIPSTTQAYIQFSTSLYCRVYIRQPIKMFFSYNMAWKLIIKR